MDKSLYIMTQERARRELPIFSQINGEESVQKLKSHEREIKIDRFKKRYGLTLIVFFLWAASIMLSCCVTGSIVHKNTREETEAELSKKYAAELQAYKNEEAAKRIVTGDASRAEAMKADCIEIAKVLYGIRQNSKDDLRTAVWCVLNRVNNSGYPSSVAEVCKQKDQWMGYSEENPVLDDLFNIAYEQVEIWYGGIRPVSPDYIYMNWTPTEITLRDNWENGSSTHYWRYDK